MLTHRTLFSLERKRKKTTRRTTHQNIQPERSPYVGLLHKLLTGQVTHKMRRFRIHVSEFQFDNYCMIGTGIMGYRHFVTETFRYKTFRKNLFGQI